MTERAADIRVAWLVYVRTYCVPTATLNQNKRTRLLYLGHAQIIIARDLIRAFSFCYITLPYFTLLHFVTRSYTRLRRATLRSGTLRHYTLIEVTLISLACVGSGVLSYIGSMGMCGAKGYGFLAVLV